MGAHIILTTHNNIYSDMLVSPYQSSNIGKDGWLKDDLHYKRNTVLRCFTWLNRISKRKFVRIFKGHYDDFTSIDDDNRLQFERPNIDNAWFRDIVTCLQAKLDTIQRGLKIVYWSVLWSKPGGVMQSEHADYPDLLFPCYSGLLSFDDSTKLHIREGNKVREIIILAGECKCPYCPVSFDERHLLQYHKNICVHGITADEIRDFRGRQAARTKKRKSNN